MRYFLDTEFIEKPNTIELISIGIKCEDGRKYYAVSSEYKYQEASEWVKDNVIIKIYNDVVYNGSSNNFNVERFHVHYGKPIESIKDELLEFIGEEPEFWGYYSDYDWVVFCWIFGSMIDLPKGYPMYCMDLKQSLESLGKRAIMPPTKEHNALVDAEWNEKLYNHIFDNA